MSLEFTQSNTASNCGPGAYCSGLTAHADASPVDAIAAVFGSPGSIEQTLTCDNNVTDRRGVYFECTPPSDTTWAAGNWTIRFNLTTSDADVTWDSLHICRIDDPGCSNQQTIASESSLGISLATTGVKSHTLAGAASTPSVDDRVMIILGISNSAISGTHTIGITPDQDISSPYTGGVALPEITINASVIAHDVIHNVHPRMTKPKARVQVIPFAVVRGRQPLPVIEINPSIPEFTSYTRVNRDGISHKVR